MNKTSIRRFLGGYLNFEVVLGVFSLLTSYLKTALWRKMGCRIVFEKINHSSFVNLRFLCLLAITLASFMMRAEPPLLSKSDLASPPGKVVRTCCAFGADVRLRGIPFVQVTDIISSEDLGLHHFLGGKGEGNGVIYTVRGGFIDIGHLRDVADWTAYVHARISAARDQSGLTIALGKEGGRKVIEIEQVDGMSTDDRISLAARIAIDLSTWHEIATWFGASYIPFVPERYSSFSPEDLYSNLLGALIGIEAINDPRPYEVAVTELLNQKLLELGAVDSERETLDAMESVRNIWWSSEYALPSRRFLVKRYFGNDERLIPWLIPSLEAVIDPCILNIPKMESGGSNWPYNFRIEAPKRLPPSVKSIIGESECLDQFDFRFIVDLIELERK